jgi:arylsulfatase A-like enzyme
VFASTLTWTLIRYIWELDQAVGRVVNALSNAGLAPEDTIIVFASDNGAPPETGADGRNWPLTGTHTHAHICTQHTRTHAHAARAQHARNTHSYARVCTQNKNRDGCC